VIRRAARAGFAISAAVAAIACITHVAACKNEGTYVYLGRFYLESRACLGTTSSIDVLSGEAPGTTCEPVCLVQRRADGGRAVYVSTMCPPYPPAEFDTSGQEPVCAQALAALSRGDTCATDGGSSQPLVDAGTSAEASTDASTDASADADAD
jgi:hypothetical protein